MENLTRLVAEHKLEAKRSRRKTKKKKVAEDGGTDTPTKEVNTIQYSHNLLIGTLTYSGINSFTDVNLL